MQFCGCTSHGCAEHTDGQKTNRYNILNEDALFKLQCRKNALECLEEVDECLIVWEHTWLDMKKNNDDVKAFMKNFNLKDVPAAMLVRECFKGGICLPMSLYSDAALAMDQVKEKYNTEGDVSLKDFLGSFADFNSMYPSVNVSPARGPFKKQIQYTPVPGCAGVLLVGNVHANEVCTPECDKLVKHKCGPKTNCQRTCPRMKDVRNHPKCTPMCERQCLYSQETSLRACGRLDRHPYCREGDTCWRCCLIHHPPSQYSKCPGIVTLR